MRNCPHGCWNHYTKKIVHAYADATEKHHVYVAPPYAKSQLWYWLAGGFHANHQIDMIGTQKRESSPQFFCASGAEPTIQIQCPVSPTVFWWIFLSPVPIFFYIGVAVQEYT